MYKKPEPPDLISLAVTELAEGRRALFVGRSSEVVREAVVDIQAAAPSGLIRGVFWGRGSERITATGGGEILFRTQGISSRGVTADTLLLDRVDDPDASRATDALTGAKTPRMYRR